MTTTQIAIRLQDEELTALDREVDEGRAASRTDAIRRAIALLERAQRYIHDEKVLLELARHGDLVYPDLQVFVDLTHPELD